jgi:two-component system, chemotaxis family, protein-glutamate methylesterase/glutaminase
MRILIAEDDAALANFVRQGLQAEHYTVDVAAEGEQARAMGTEHDYDLVVLDLNLPRMDGVNVLRHLRLKRPSLPVLVLTLRSKVEDRVQCLDTGADDYVPKQLSAASLDILHVRDALIAKIKTAAQLHAAAPFQIAPRKAPRAAGSGIYERPFSIPEIIALGTSTGGPKALQDILPSLPADLPVPILIVQHMPLGFTGPFARRLDDLSAVSIREAVHQDVLEPGVVYIAPAGVHLTVELTNSLTMISLSDRPKHQLHTPSVDIMMQSVASVFHAGAMGVIMTGMGTDGAQGMKAIHREGGFTVGQDEASCAVYGMPRVCAEMGILDRVVPLAQIPGEILHATRYRRASIVQTGAG